MQTACAAAESCTECLDCHLKAIRRRAETNFCNFCRKAKKSFYQAVLDDIKLTNEPLAASLKEVNGRCLRTSAELFPNLLLVYPPLWSRRRRTANEFLRTVLRRQSSFRSTLLRKLRHHRRVVSRVRIASWSKQCLCCHIILLSLIHIWRCRRSYACRSRWSPYH